MKDVEDLGELAPDGFVTTGVVTAACEMLNGASGVLEATCNRDEMIALARRKAAAAGGHGLVDTRCKSELLERRHEMQDGGGVKVSTRERLTCQATVVRWTKGGPIPVAKATASASAKVAADGRKVVVDDIPFVVAFKPSAAYRKRASRDVSTVGELDATPSGYAALGQLEATCRATCAPRHGRVALRREAARLGGTAIAAVHCEVAGADRWQCTAAVIGEPTAAKPPTEPPPPAPEEAAPKEAVPDAAFADAGGAAAAPPDLEDAAVAE